MLADDAACNARNKFPGCVYSSSAKTLDLYGDNIEVDYRGYEVTVENFLRVLTGRVDPSVPRSKRLLTDDRSNVFIYMTGHGGNEFLKFQDNEEISAFDIADAVAQMWEKKRYNELFFMIDTCQANTMYSKFYSPNVLATGSSVIHENSYSYENDRDIGVAVIDTYTHYILEYMEGINKTSQATMQDLFDTYDPVKINSHPGVREDLFPRSLRNTLVTDFFGGVVQAEVLLPPVSNLDAPPPHIRAYTPSEADIISGASAADGLPETQVLRADGWRGPYYDGLSPVASVAAPQDRPIGEARLSLLKRKQELEKELRSVLTLLNAGVPIHTLPVELLAEIFKATQPELGREDGAAQPWLGYLLVCRYWFTVGATTPMLWNYLYAKPSLNYLRTCLARSKDVKIDVVVPDVPRMVPEVMFYILPHLHRVRSLMLGTVSAANSPHLKRFLQETMPALELFSAVLGIGMLHSNMIEFTPERFPKLVNVSVDGIYLVKTAAFRRLKVLQIYGQIELFPVMTTDTLTDLLRELTSIEELRIYHMICYRDDPAIPRPTPTARVILPSLRTLTLRNFGSPVTEHVLSVISIPPSSTVHIYALADIQPGGGVAPFSAGGTRSLLPADRTGLPILSSATEVFIDSTGASERGHVVKLSGPPTPAGRGCLKLVRELHLEEYLDHLRAHPLPPDLTDVCRDAPIQAMRIEVEAESCERVSWRDALAPFVALRELAVFGEEGRLRGQGFTDYGGGGPSAAPVFSGLDPDAAPVDTPVEARLVLPELRKLRVEGFSAMDGALLPTVMNFLERRRAALGRPKALEILSLKLGGQRRPQFSLQLREMYTQALSEYVDVLTFETWKSGR
ncbi:GPI-anchor transamidase [Trametes pubescens]|uniref:GPI-anchor transamidase n=1 Tax=Trametes pubescens TaxID=154538 RepID=A0A1M2V4U0_TRAPU|nr:GPI-anchor transamidase [Trametes pubescens]